MKMKLRYMAAGLALLLGLSGCSVKGNPVPVERVDTLTAAAVAADKFAGVVVSDNTVNIAREADKDIKELLVAQGDQVSEGQKLFTYDTDQLQLTVDKQELEMDRLEKDIDDKEDAVEELEKTLKNTKDTKETADLRATYELNLRTAQMELTQAEYEKAALQTEIDYNKKMLKNVNVTSPIDGTVRSINEDNNEEYIVIQQTGAYRIKGLLNEMSMGMGIMEGVRVQILSRLQPDQSWYGTVEKVDYENAEQNTYDSMYYGYASDSMTSTSSYPFYIALDSTDGLLLGQHVYIQLAVQDTNTDAVYIPESYLMDLVYSDETGMVTATVWAVGEEGTLTKRNLILGDYDMTTGSYLVSEGLAASDYVADPANPDCKEGAEVTYNDGGSGLTAQQQAAIEASIANSIEYAEE